MDQYKIYRHVLCIDLKSFYASVECALRGLDPFKTPLIVADKSRGGGSIVLAISPFLKAQGLPSRFRLHALPSIPNLIIAKPRMHEYLRVSRDVIEIYLNFVSREDLHIYSIDEAFLDVTAYLKYYRKTSSELAQTILDTILKKTKIPATCGIGDNMLLSKLALDLESKKNASGIAKWHYSDVEKKIWSIKPLSNMWGIGPRLEKRLNALNIYSVYDLAHANIKTLKRQFGLIGEELYYHAHGIDMSVISEGFGMIRHVKSVGLGQTLFRDYSADMVPQIMLEMIDEVAEKLRFMNQEGQTLHLFMRYSKAYGGGFSRQIKLEHPTSDPRDLFQAAWHLMGQHYDDLPVRQIGVRVTQLRLYQPFEQISLFQQMSQKKRRMAYLKALDQIKQRYGQKAIHRLSYLFEHGTALERTQYVGGHHG